ncbi:Polysaccharide deacetylase [Thiothrix eikelboomii]|uniref:Polysaccharide deacetylase n=1 Tax=Thiothrix eikelboomii TaxID=92487 RepID=A0A1T4XFJ5_9GAMM|nr:polysaccharide deacetylase family protein [Thiothrix eikelboomii]SKA87825.1 Polysaccharide deacetylase [Thiothrix eikelboomii]
MKFKLVLALIAGLFTWTGMAQAVDCAAVRARFQCDAATHYPLHLSFDDGPALQTTEVLQVLKQEKIPATFFVIANKVDCPALEKQCKAEHGSKIQACLQPKQECEQRRQILLQAKRAGHVIGSHSYEHLRYSEVEQGLMREHFRLARQVLDPYLNTTPPLFRLSYGDGWFNRQQHPQVLAALKANGFQHIAWQLSAFDWDENNQQGDKILTNVLEQVCKRRQGGVVLFHDGVHDQLHTGRLFTTTHLKDWIPSLRCVVDFKPLSFFETGYTQRR